MDVIEVVCIFGSGWFTGIACMLIAKRERDRKPLDPELIPKRSTMTPRPTPPTTGSGVMPPRSPFAPKAKRLSPNTAKIVAAWEQSKSERVQRWGSATEVAPAPKRPEVAPPIRPTYQTSPTSSEFAPEAEPIKPPSIDWGRE